MRTAIWFVWLLIAAAACGGRGSPTVASPAVVPSIGPVTISGNGRLTAPGQTTQLTATATMSDGAQKDVTSTVTWRSSNSRVVTVAQTGLVTAADFGQASIDVLVPAGSSTTIVRPLSIFVLPEGTYILYGQCVQDLSRVSDGRTECLADARIEIVGGPMTGRATITDQGGNWTFMDVSGVLQVRASKDGYITAVQDVPPGAGRDVVALCGPGLVPVGGQPIRAVPGCI